MPSRRPLTVISGNGKRGKELSPYVRGQIKGLQIAKYKHIEIAKTLNIPLGTVATTLTRSPIRKDGKSRPRSGRPPITSARDRRRILIIVKKNSDLTYNQIRAETGLKISDRTIYRILQSFYLEH